MMLEVCSYTDGSNMATHTDMKHSKPNIESFEFNIGRAQQLRCQFSQKATVCGECETCVLSGKLSLVRDWFPRLGDQSKKRFMLGLMKRCRSVDLLNHILNLLEPLQCKDYTYARMRTNPSLLSDQATLSSDRALPSGVVDHYMSTTWDWFQEANYWTKSNFAFFLLQLCDSHLLHSLTMLTKTLVLSEERAVSTVKDPTYTEASSIAGTEYSYHTDRHPELAILSQVNPEYCFPKYDPFTGEEVHLEGEIENADSGSESDDSILSLDPTYFVVSSSVKAHAGVQRYKDFIRCLPVHISKYILSLLDEASLHSAKNVSANWKVLVDEVLQEFYVNQHLWEEVMLMQGAAAQGVNPNYANDVDVLVPNLHPGTREVILTDEEVIKPAFKSEINFETAYSGVSKRKVIMEERNKYCGSYNVLVLSDQEDMHRAMHTDGGKLIAVGSKDRKVRFLDSESGREKGPLITGHAGSVRCVYLAEKRGIVLSGSYDTSIRCWDIETGQCLKILRGHQDTVLTILLHGDMVASGSKDATCKIWNLETRKCLRTFRHRHPINAVAMSSEICITGCEKGKVKVWDLSSGKLIKCLKGHQGAITAIRFDRWHIITGSKDGYALAWSSQGNHDRCLIALRHPKEVLCLEFLYLRVITGSADGRLRIWNVVTGQCCRIMRGNSRSVPIHSITAFDDRITLNTHLNLLAMKFESVDWDYTMDTDKVPPLVHYGSYSDAPVREQPYSYIRAQRMRKAGATNLKIIHHDKTPATTCTDTLSQYVQKAQQIPHSAKTLSARSLSSARQLHISQIESGYDSHSPSPRQLDTAMSFKSDGEKSRYLTSPSLKTPVSKSKSVPSHIGVTISKHDDIIPDEEVKMKQLQINRRTSWAFEKPVFPDGNEVTLQETKALLRSQMRMKPESIIPPEFIYMTVRSIQESMKHSDMAASAKLNNLLNKCHSKRQRPVSSPSRIDPRTKIPVHATGLDNFLKAEDVDKISEFSETKSSMKFDRCAQSMPIPPKKEVYATKFSTVPVKVSDKQSLQPKRIKSSLPRGRIVRPLSASVRCKERDPPVQKAGRPSTAPMATSKSDLMNVSSNVASCLPGAPLKCSKSKSTHTCSKPPELVPMLMYPADFKEKLTKLKEERKVRCSLVPKSASDTQVGNISPFSDPMRKNTKFELRTHLQDEEYIASIEKNFEVEKIKEEEFKEKEKKKAWLAKIQRDSKKIKIRPCSASAGLKQYK